MKALVILIDGMRPDAMEACGSSIPEELMQHSYYTMDAQTVFPPVTLPCHLSLFQSVEPARHGTVGNKFSPSDTPVDGIAEVLRAAGRTAAMFYTWEELRDITRPDSLMKGSFLSGNIYGFEKASKILTKEARTFLKKERPDFCFFYLGAADDEGHKSGWMSKEYLRTVRQSLKWAKTVYEAAGDDYVTILLADHGGHDHNHGLQIQEDMTIPVFVYHPSFKKTKLSEVSILDIAPTVTKIIGVKAPEDWRGSALPIEL